MTITSLSQPVERNGFDPCRRAAKLDLEPELDVLSHDDDLIGCDKGFGSVSFVPVVTRNGLGSGDGGRPVLVAHVAPNAVVVASQHARRPQRGADAPVLVDLHVVFAVARVAVEAYLCYGERLFREVRVEQHVRRIIGDADAAAPQRGRDAVSTAGSPSN
jgi:hypothetical protein